MASSPEPCMPKYGTTPRIGFRRVLSGSSRSLARPESHLFLISKHTVTVGALTCPFSGTDGSLELERPERRQLLKAFLSLQPEQPSGTCSHYKAMATYFTQAELENLARLTGLGASNLRGRLRGISSARDGVALSFAVRRVIRSDRAFRVRQTPAHWIPFAKTS